MNDTINAAFELIGAFLTWRNFAQLRRDREIKGVYWPATAFWSLWGLWNLYYYPSLGQWLSFTAGAVLVGGNLAWVGYAVWLWGEKSRPFKEVREAENRAANWCSICECPASECAGKDRW